MNFPFYMPVNIHFGEDIIDKHKDIFSQFGRHAQIVTGKRSSKLNGSLDDVCRVLDSQKIKYTIFNEVEPNPSLETVKKGAAAAREASTEFIIGIGGGSALDAAKAIAVLTHNNLEGEEVFAGKYSSALLPVIAVPTTAGTGSEVTQYAIISDHVSSRKRNLGSQANFPKYAFLDPRYTADLQLDHTINTGLDAFSHLAEGYLATRSSDMSDSIAEKGFAIIGRALKHLGGEISMETRSDFLYTSMLAGIVIAQTGTTAMHAMGYALTLHKDINHGRANALIMNEYFSFINKAQFGKVNKMLLLMGFKSQDEFNELLNSLLGSKENLSLEELTEYSEASMKEGHMKNTIPEPDLEDIIDIYRKSFKV